jgi:hypothetical protein
MGFFMGFSCGGRKKESIDSPVVLGRRRMFSER